MNRGTAYAYLAALMGAAARTSAFESAQDATSDERRIRPESRRWIESRWALLEAEIDREAANLASLTDADLGAAANQMRESLRTNGPSVEQVGRCFALAREASARALDMRHQPSQLKGGWYLLNGWIAEMETGQGKTLTATLPAVTLALAGVPVHVISANDYLVKRDAEELRPLYRRLGIRVGTVTAHTPPTARNQSYRRDVTYCTGKEVVFDHLRDRALQRNSVSALAARLRSLCSDQPLSARLATAGLCFAIVDEADSILIDEARTPLILSQTGDRHEERQIYQQALCLARHLEADRDFCTDARASTIELTPAGSERALGLAKAYGDLWQSTQRTLEWTRQALTALHLMRKDKQYLVQEGLILIVDASTGRTLPDRSWERGLHQMIELKENCQPTPGRDTLARVSYQRFFRRYCGLSGMTGTAWEVRRELRKVYGLNVKRIAPDWPVRRLHGPERVYDTEAAKWRAVLERIGEYHQIGRPVLVGTSSVEESERLSSALEDFGLPHEVLNARHDFREAEIIARAGRRGAITVATNMAGRGTDIGLADGIAELGGLHVIATCRNVSARVDRQLFGRSARRGNPGSCEALVSLEDDIVTQFHPASSHAAGVLGKLGRRLGRGRHRQIPRLAQRAAEAHAARLRQEIMDKERREPDLLAFAGTGD